MPDREAQAGLFGEAYFRGGVTGGYADFDADEALHRANARDRLAALAREGAAPPGTLLDVGCATGYFLDEARKADWAVKGVDASPHARERAGALGIEAQPDLETVARAGAGPFDVVTFYQVLEHMSDPLAAMRDARGLLKPRGLVVVETWDRGSMVARLAGRHWQQANPPSVAYLFDRGSLARLLERAGFLPPDVRVTGKRVRSGFALRIAAEKLPRVAGPISSFAARTGLDRATVKYRLGDLVTAFARAKV
jgi:SAM-dependent methyltransferase